MYWTLVFLSYRQHFIIAINQGLGYYAILCYVEVQTNGFNGTESEYFGSDLLNRAI